MMVCGDFLCHAVSIIGRASVVQWNNYISIFAYKIFCCIPDVYMIVVKACRVAYKYVSVGWWGSAKVVAIFG